MEILIETERLILRPVTLDDTQDFFEMDSNPNVHKYLGNNPVKYLDQSKAWIEDILDQYEAYGLGRLAVVKKTTNEFLGWSGIKYEITRACVPSSSVVKTKLPSSKLVAPS